MTNWYGENITIEEAKQATQELREAIASKRGQYFDVKRGQVLLCEEQQAVLRAGEVAISLKDTPDHSLFLHPNENDKYIGYRAFKKYFTPANDEQINDFFGVEAKIEKIEGLDQLSQDLSNYDKHINPHGKTAAERLTDGHNDISEEPENVKVEEVEEPIEEEADDLEGFDDDIEDTENSEDQPEAEEATEPEPEDEENDLDI